MASHERHFYKHNKMAVTRNEMLINILDVLELLDDVFLYLFSCL